MKRSDSVSSEMLMEYLLTDLLFTYHARMAIV